MRTHENLHRTKTAEDLFCTHPGRCPNLDMAILGSSVGLVAARHSIRYAKEVLGRNPVVGVFDAGPFDHLSHMANNPGFRRVPFIRGGTERVGGKSTVWGVSTPRPPTWILDRWPYPKDDLTRRFEAVEAELGVADPTPGSGGPLERIVLDRLANALPECTVRVAPTAINRWNERWSSVKYVPNLVEDDGVKLVARFRCTEIVVHDRTVVGIRGMWRDGAQYEITTRTVFVATGPEPSIPLLRPVCRSPIPLQPADHLRIDSHGRIPFGACDQALNDLTADGMGVAVLLVEGTSQAGVPWHIEVKAAPVALWNAGYLPSSDNLSARDEARELQIQVQVVAAMHDRLPAQDLLQVPEPIPPVMSHRDAVYHGQLVERMAVVSAALGLPEPTYCLRPLLTNHHVYGLYRVGAALDPTFQFRDCDGLYVLPPTGFVDADDDANPMLKSLVLAQYPAEAAIERLAEMHAQSNVLGREQRTLLKQSSR
jgi:hypothetical protein